MKQLIHRKSATVPPLRRGSLLVLLLVTAYALSQTAQAVKPPPDGGYKNENTAEGRNALFNLTTGMNNTAIGFRTLYTLTTGSENTATGSEALSDSTASFDTADGFQALHHNLTGFHNTATGWRALFENTIGFENTATGAGALFSNTTGIDNTATGAAALYTNTKGRFNTATGYQALAQNTTGESNTANGVDSLLNNTTGHHNTAVGWAALDRNTTGELNTAVGVSALAFNVTGGANIALGYGAGGFITGDYNIDIGSGGVAGEDKTIRIGESQLQLDTYIAGIFGTNLAGPPVVVTADGHLGVGAASSARFKDEIKPMAKASEAILALKPVTFYYKKEIDPKRGAQFGLVAEEVEKVNPALITRDRDGKPYTVRYDAVNAMLLNEFLKEHRTVEELKTTVAKQEAIIAQLESTVAKQETIGAAGQKEIKALAATVKEQASQIRKVSAQLELQNLPAATVAVSQ